ALRYKALAVHQSTTRWNGRLDSRKWTITHVPTGFAIANGIPSYSEALEIAFCLMEGGGSLWEKGSPGSAKGLPLDRLRPIVLDAVPDKYLGHGPKLSVEEIQSGVTPT